MIHACRIITGCLKATPIPCLYALAGIASPHNIRRTVASNADRCLQDDDPRHPLHGQCPAKHRLPSRNSFLDSTEALDTSKQDARTTLWVESGTPLVNDQLSGVTERSSQMNSWPAAQMSLGPPGAALDISTGPVARGIFQTAGPVRASTFYLSLARKDHLDINRATRFQIVLARTITKVCTFRTGAVPHLGSFRAILLLQRDASVSRVGHVNQTH